MLLPQVSERLLAANGLDQDVLAQQLRQLMSHQIEFGDFYFQSGVHESWILEDGIVKDGSYNIEQGVGVRAISGEKTGFAYSDELSLNALQQAVIAARGVAASGGEGQIKIWQPAQAEARYLALDPLPGLPQQHKIALLEELDQFARSLDPRITQVMASLSGVYEEVLIAATDGTLVGGVGQTNFADVIDASAAGTNGAVIHGWGGNDALAGSAGATTSSATTGMT